MWDNVAPLFPEHKLMCDGKNNKAFYKRYCVHQHVDKTVLCTMSVLCSTILLTCKILTDASLTTYCAFRINPTWKLLFWLGLKLQHDMKQTHFRSLNQLVWSRNIHSSALGQISLVESLGYGFSFYSSSLSTEVVFIAPGQLGGTVSTTGVSVSLFCQSASHNYLGSSISGVRGTAAVALSCYQITRSKLPGDLQPLGKPWTNGAWLLPFTRCILVCKTMIVHLKQMNLNLFLFQRM